MEQSALQDTGLARDELLVRVFTLADHAVTPPDGKLYMNGGGVDQMLMQQIPGGLGPLSMAIRIRIPWHMTSELLNIQLRALNADRQPVGQDPLMNADVEVGRAPGLRPGDENCVSLAFPLTGFPVQEEGTIYFHLSVAGKALSVLPLKIQRLVVAQVGPAARP
jgi:hypothetical protein